MLWDDLIKEVKEKGKISSRFRLSEPKLSKCKSIRKRYKRWYLSDCNRDIYLTTREVDCTRQLLLGKTIIQIAAELGLSPRTVEYYVNNLKQKLSCNSKSEVIQTLINTNLKKILL